MVLYFWSVGLWNVVKMKVSDVSMVLCGVKMSYKYLMTSVSPIGLTSVGLRRGLFLALRARHRSRAGAGSGREITKTANK